jgi:hypothetical protein
MSETSAFAQAYPAQLVAIREGISGMQNGAPTPWQLPNVQQPQTLTLSHLPGDLADIQLIFRPSDLYLLGFVNLVNVTYAFENQVTAVQNSVSMGFEDAYKDMGVDRDSWITVTVDEVEQALWDIAYAGGAPGKATLGKLVVGFCEAARFADIERSVVSGARFDGKLLKWESTGRALADKLLTPA